jgi:protein TonB
VRLRDDPEAAKLAACLAVSLAAHAGFVAWLPELRRHESATIPAVLSVALPPAARPAAPAPPAAAADAPHEPHPARAPLPKPAPRAPAPPRAAPPPPSASAATPREPAATSPAVVAAAPPSPEPAVPAGPQADGARTEATAAAAPRAAAGAQSAVVPPSYGAAYLRNPAPRYPAAARREGAEGTVLLRVWVGADGGPTRVEVDRSSGHRALDAAALGAVGNWRFVPAQRGGEAVEGVVTVPLVFRLEPGG